MRHELAPMAPYRPDSAPRYALTEQERRHLEDIDDRLVRWRRTLREIRLVRDQLDERAKPTCESTPKWFKAVCMIALMPAVRLYHADQHLETARRRLDWLVDRFIIEPLTTLPKKLAGGGSMRPRRDEFEQVCESLSHRDAIETSPSTSSTDSCSSDACEQELLSAIDHVIADRAEVLRTYRRSSSDSRRTIDLGVRQLVPL